MRNIPGTILIILLLAVATSFAGELSPVGKWKTIDDKTNAPGAIMELYQGDDGKIDGKIAEVLLEANKKKICSKCTGDQKDQPFTGLIVVRGLAWDGKKYSGGTLMDPDDGNTYSCFMSVTEDGKKLKVRAYIGVPGLGRSQIWYRVE